jgi:hypothetical protein
MSAADTTNGAIYSNAVFYPIGEKILQRSVIEGPMGQIPSKLVSTPSGIQIQLGDLPTPSDKDVHHQQDKSMGTTFEFRVRSIVTHQDTFLDNDIGDTIKFIKNNFGDSPLIEAYEAALDTFKEPDRRWKEYLDEEEAKFKSIFE